MRSTIGQWFTASLCVEGFLILLQGSDRSLGIEGSNSLYYIQFSHETWIDTFLSRHKLSTIIVVFSVLLFSFTTPDSFIMFITFLMAFNIKSKWSWFRLTIYYINIYNSRCSTQRMKPPNGRPTSQPAEAVQKVVDHSSKDTVSEAAAAAIPRNDISILRRRRWWWWGKKESK